MRLAILFTNYGPYHIARVAASQAVFAASGHEIVAIELAQHDPTYPWLVDRANLPFPIVSIISAQPLADVSLAALHRQVWQQLSGLELAGVAIAGYAHPGMLSALGWCWRHGKAAILMSDTKADDAPRQRWKEAPKRLLLQRFRAALVAGAQHKAYLVGLGMRPEVIFLGYDVVDNATFHPDRLRSLPCPVERPFFLTISRFVPKKNLSRLLAAYGDYCRRMPAMAWDLVLCGDGPQRPALEQQIQQAGLQDKVHLPGFLQQQDLLPYFAHAGALIHASVQEQWGLVVNEAMAAGLPVLVSRRCGCFEDLVREGHNGFGFDPENPAQLTDLMLKLSADGSDRTLLGQAALAHIQKYGLDSFAQGLLAAAQTALSQSTNELHPRR